MSSMIEDLLKPEALPDKTEKVDVVQTHISVVFVADAFVYKIKKRVNFGFLDFSTLEKREFYCHQEVKLNRRLAPDIYVGVLPVRLFNGRHLLRGENGRIVDFSVKMKKIHVDKLMKSRFERGRLNEAHLKKVARVVARFHGHAQRNTEIDQYGRPERFRINSDENFDQVEKYIGITIDDGVFKGLKAWTDDFYKARQGLFFQRVREKRIRDCHGDLHMEHICISKDISIIDCIEFSDRLRYGDVLVDIGFLLMDLEFHGGAHLSAILWDEYKRQAKEGDVEDLLTFYKVYRAFVRGKVNSFQLDDPSIDQTAKQEALEKARKYFALAHAYIQ